MKYYVAANSDGTYGFYIEGVSETIPSGAVEIAEDQWQDATNNQGKYSIVNGVFTAASVWPTVQTKDEKIDALNATYQTQIADLAQQYSTALMADKLYSTSTADGVYAEYEALITEYTTALEALE